MAKMYPPDISPDVKSAAEKKLFQRIRSQLPDDWLVLHSLGLKTHSTKIWAEVDFVLIGPPGVYCLEVKGGLVERQNGVWRFTDRFGRRSSKREGPFEQVQTATQDIRTYLEPQLPWLNNVAVGWGVAVPDSSLREVEGPEIEHQVVYEIEDTMRPFTVYMGRLASFWRSKLTERKGQSPRHLNDEQRAALRDALRPDFVAVPSLRARIGVAKDEIFVLTREQYSRLDELVYNERSLLRGGAGTGKTMLAVEAAMRLANEGCDIFFCCRSPHLAAHLRTVFRELLTVSVWDIGSFMRSAVSDADLLDALPDADEDSLLAVFLPEACLEALAGLDRFDAYDALIVDEAQDLLLDPFLSVFDAVLRKGLRKGRWMFFYDEYQDLFHGVPRHGLIRLLQDTGAAQLRLTRNCRNTRPIAEDTYVLSGVPQSPTLKAEGPKVVHRWYRSPVQERELVSDTVRALLNDVPPQDVVILSRRPQINTCLRDGLIDVSQPVRYLDHTHPKTPAVATATIADFKGLESDVVLVIDIDDLDDPEALYSLYVAASRARAYLVLFLDTRVKGAFERRWFEYGRQLAAEAELAPS